MVSTESGLVVGYDIRQPTGPVFEFLAHKGGCTNLDFSPHMPSMLATVGLDGYCKVWDLNNVASGGNKPVHKKNMKQGVLHSLQFYDDEPWVLAVGGSRGEPAIWDTEEAQSIHDHFAEEAKP